MKCFLIQILPLTLKFKFKKTINSLIRCFIEEIFIFYNNIIKLTSISAESLKLPILAFPSTHIADIDLSHPKTHISHVPRHLQHNFTLFQKLDTCLEVWVRSGCSRLFYAFPSFSLTPRSFTRIPHSLIYLHQHNPPAPSLPRSWRRYQRWQRRI